MTGNRAGTLPRLDVFGACNPRHYRPSGVGRLYAMTLAGGVRTLTRESPDRTPLDFRQRFTGASSEDGNSISGARETCLNGSGWMHDFALTYRRAG